MTLAELSTDELARRCADETERYARREASDDSFCFELLRRALADGVAEAFTRVYQVYERRVLGWVLGHSAYARAGESAEYLATEAWSAFYFAVRGPRFAGFPALSHALQYLKVCVHTSIMRHIRDQHPGAELPLDAAPEMSQEADLGQLAAAGEVWRRVADILSDEQDRLLARCVLVEDLKPSQIVVAHPGRWRDEREVAVETYRIRRALRRDPELRRLFEGA